MLRRTCSDSRTTSYPATVAVPAVGRQQRGQHPQRRGLAGAVGPEEADDLALGDVEVDAVDGAHLGLLRPCLGVEGLHQTSRMDHAVPLSMFKLEYCVTLDPPAGRCQPLSPSTDPRTDTNSSTAVAARRASATERARGTSAGRGASASPGRPAPAPRPSARRRRPARRRGPPRAGRATQSRSTSAVDRCSSSTRTTCGGVEPGDGGERASRPAPPGARRARAAGARGGRRPRRGRTARTCSARCAAAAGRAAGRSRATSRTARPAPSRPASVLV